MTKPILARVEHLEEILGELAPGEKLALSFTRKLKYLAGWI
jgi:hypothetical protein